MAKRKKKRKPPAPKPATGISCFELGEALEKAWCHVDIAMGVVWNEKLERHDPFPWRNLSAALMGLQEAKKKAPHLRSSIEKVEKTAESLRSAVYRTPGAERRISDKQSRLYQEITALRNASRSFCRGNG